MKLSAHTSLIRDVDGLLVVSEQTIDPLVEANNELRKQRGNLIGTQKHMLHVAEMPTKLYMQLKARFGPMKHNQRAWKQWMNDPDNRVFRTWPGTV